MIKKIVNLVAGDEPDDWEKQWRKKSLAYEIEEACCIGNILI